MAEENTASAEASSPTALVYDDVFKLHETPPGHPESVRRLDAVMDALAGADFGKELKRLEPRDAADEELTACHSPAYVKRAKQDIALGLPMLSTGDTWICPRSLSAALRAAGAVCVAVDAVVRSQVKNAFCVVRPPGHHAGKIRGMGFCIFNNLAIGARRAQRQHGIGKVLIVDWDVHHGNGTQDIFYEDGSVLFFSTHQSPWYPGTGSRNETGSGQGKGTTINRPFPAGAGREEIVGAFQKDLLPAADSFKPELVLISAGFDSRIGDPLGHFRLTDDDFVELTGIALEIARRHAGGRVVSVLEGGYRLSGLASAARAHCGKLHSG